MSCNTFIPIMDLVREVEALLAANYIDKDDPRITGGVFTNPTIKEGFLLDVQAREEFCRLVQECGLDAPFGKMWLSRPLYPDQMFVSYEDSGEPQTKWRTIQAVLESAGVFGPAATSLSSRLAAEIDRATAAENGIILRAEAADDDIAANRMNIATNATAISTERGRAVAAEGVLTSAVDALELKDLSLQSQVNSIGGGKKAYVTYALMVADKDNITANSSIDVTNDTDPLKNGTYSYDGAEFTKSIYDPLALAKDYSDKKIDQDASTDLVRLEDKDGILYGLIDAEGSLYLPNMKNSVQDSVKKISDIISTNDETALFNLIDTDGNTVSFIDDKGALYVPDVITSEGTFSSAIKNINTVTESNNAINSSYSSLIKSIDGIRVGEQTPSNDVHILADAAEIEGFSSVFAPCIIRMTKTRFYLVFEARQNGDDHSPINIVGRTIDYDHVGQTFTKGAIKNIALSGVTTGGVSYSYLNPVVTYVESGINAGRILVHFNYMTNPDGLSGSSTERDYAPYYVYSDDGGDSFTAPINMTALFPWDKFGAGNLMVYGPGHGIQIRNGKYKGRLILSAYTRHPIDLDGTGKWFASRVIYSDDGGDTYSWGEAIENPGGLNEWQAAELANGDIVGIFRVSSGRNFRCIGYSKDGGISFENMRVISEIKGAGVKTGFVNCENPFDYSLPKLVAITPSDETQSASGRVNAHVWISYDDGQTWSEGKQIGVGTAQYSDATHINPDYILTLYGGGTHIRGNQVIANLINLNFILEK